MTKLRIELNGVVEQMEHYKNDFTKEGLAKGYQETVKRQKARCPYRKSDAYQVREWHAGAQSASASAIEAAYPAGGTCMEQLSVEMAVQRILSRPGLMTMLRVRLSKICQRRRCARCFRRSLQPVAWCLARCSKPCCRLTMRVCTSAAGRSVDAYRARSVGVLRALAGDHTG